jgi:hypothetical protein
MLILLLSVICYGLGLLICYFPLDIFFVYFFILSVEKSEYNKYDHNEGHKKCCDLHNEHMGFF